MRVQTTHHCSELCSKIGFNLRHVFSQNICKTDGNRGTQQIKTTWIRLKWCYRVISKVPPTRNWSNGVEVGMWSWSAETLEKQHEKPLLTFGGLKRDRNASCRKIIIFWKWRRWGRRGKYKGREGRKKMLCCAVVELNILSCRMGSWGWLSLEVECIFISLLLWDSYSPMLCSNIVRLCTDVSFSNTYLPA